MKVIHSISGFKVDIKSVVSVGLVYNQILNRPQKQRI